MNCEHLTQSEIIQDKFQDVNLFLNLIKHYTIRKCRGVNVNSHEFLTLELTGYELSYSCYGQRQQYPCTGA
jgi:hypothetical protein